jgi:DNA-binding transcriptional LysR family regulator
VIAEKLVDEFGVTVDRWQSVPSLVMMGLPPEAAEPFSIDHAWATRGTIELTLTLSENPMTRNVLDWGGRLGQRLRLRDLHILSTVVQWGSMAQAAKHLAMSQPAVSEAIAQLEDALCVRLLDRSPQGVEPTIYANALLKRGLAVFDELKQGIRDIEFLRDPGVGEVRVGCSEFMAAGLLPAIIDRFSSRYPEVVIHVVDALAGMQEFRELRQRNVDLMLARVPEPVVDKDVEVDVLFEERFFVVADVRSPWARRRNITLAELINERWILQPTQVTRSLFVEAFRAQGLEVPREKVSTVSVHVRTHLVATGRYLIILPGSALRFNAKRWSLKALPVDLRVKPMPTAILTLKNRTLSSVVQVFIEHAREIAKSIMKTA